jgi:hypothetical protein
VLLILCTRDEGSINHAGNHCVSRDCSSDDAGKVSDQRGSIVASGTGGPFGSIANTSTAASASATAIASGSAMAD